MRHPAYPDDGALVSPPAAARIGLNLIFMVPGETGGMEVAVRELIPALIAQAPGVRFTAFVNRETAGAMPAWLGGVQVVTVPVNARSRVQWVAGEQTLLAPLARRVGVDLMHSLASTGPAWGPFRRVVTVHDLIYARYPEAHAGLRSAGMRLLVPLAVRRSDRVIAISQSSRRDVEELLGTPPERIDVVPQGVGAVQRAQPAPAAEVRASLALGDRRILLSLSARRPHKNLGALIDALAQIPVERRPVLVLPGYPTWQDAELAQRAERLGVAEDVRITGWLSEEQVEGLWQLADAFVFPSLYEGFGLPVLEAMARGVPVASSNAASLPEVAGDAALLFDPHDQRAIVAAVLRILDDPAEAQRLRLAGREQAGRFTWQRTAQGTLASYARALRLDGPPASWAQARGSTPGAAGATASA